MASWFGRDFKMKPYIHILAALAIWIFVVVLLGTEQSNYTMQRLDQVHTYSLSKMPAIYDNTGGARATIINSFNARWNPYTDDAPYGCMTLLNWSAGANATCKINREGLVNDVRKAMNCDLYRSPACNCVNMVMKMVANDMNANNYAFTGNFATTATKSLAGQQGNMLAALDACHFLHHPAYLATQTLSSGSAAYTANQNTLVRRVGLLFVLSTMVTGNAVVYFMLPTGYAGSGQSITRLLGVLIWPIISLATVAGIEGSAINLLLYIVLPPVAILIWYEWFSMSAHRIQFVHPFFFAVIMATLSAMALVENEVLDYDNITFEIWKAHMISFLYFGVLWFTSKQQMHSGSTEFMARGQQETVMVAFGLAIVSTLTSAVAPYTSAAYTNYLELVPLIFVLVSFMDLMFFSYFVQHEEKTSAVREGPLLISAVILIVTALVTIYFWRDYSIIYHAMWEKIPMRSVQVNDTNAWLLPTYS